jgi:trans-2-enoyl-CoA reductase
MIKTTLLHPDQVQDMWHVLKGPLKASLDHGVGESTLTDYLRRALEWQAQIWLVTNDDQIMGVALTQFLQYSTHKTLHIVGVGGTDWATWADQYYLVEEFAKQNGCTAVEQWGRPGWSKILPKAIPGFEVVYHVMRKEIQRSDDDQVQKAQ